MTEQQPYDVVTQFDVVELRRYPEHLVANIHVEGTFDTVGSAAFGALFGYISGENESAESIAMTAPVVQQPGSAQSIAMTSPVTQTETEQGWFVVAFVLPHAMTMNTAPRPTNPKVQLEVMPGGLVAATRFSGLGSASSYAEHRDELVATLATAGLTPQGPPRFAQFDAPRTPGSQRRNEVQQPVRDPGNF
ncbi:MAG: heme-binding protein [Ornithinimicrobium sp.]